MAETAEPRTEDERERGVAHCAARATRARGRALVLYETRLAAARHRPELRQAGLGAAAAAAVAVAFVTAFALANVAAVRALSESLTGWVAALVLAAGWALVGGVLALVLLARARRVRGWDVADAEAGAGRGRAGRARHARTALARGHTRDRARCRPERGGRRRRASGDIIEGADEIVEALTEGVPGGSVVNQMWDVVLMPGRLGVRVATTVLRRGGPGCPRRLRSLQRGNSRRSWTPGADENRGNVTSPRAKGRPDLGEPRGVHRRKLRPVGKAAVPMTPKGRSTG